MIDEILNIKYVFSQHFSAIKKGYEVEKNRKKIRVNCTTKSSKHHQSFAEYD